MIQQMQQVLDTPTLINKPFFSIIIPAYNCKETLLSLLQNLEEQNLTKEELQIIISDDCSTISYDYIINNFKDKLNIKKVVSKYNGGTGNARQKGVQLATGEYIAFIDQDDLFVPQVLSKVKNLLLENPGIDYLITGLTYKSSEDGSVLMQYDPFSANQQPGWIHGKFFHLENFWKKYNLHFPKDLRSHQDIALTFQLIAIQKKYKEDTVIYKTNLITYTWYKYPNSSTNKLYYYKEETKPRHFYDIWFKDYIQASLKTLLQCYKQYNYDKQKAFESCCKCLYLIYQRSERNLYENSIVIEQNYDYLNDILKEMLEYFNITISDIEKYFLDNPNQRRNIVDYAITTSVYYKCRFDFSKWLELVYNKQLSKELELEEENNNNNKLELIRPFFSVIVPCYNSKNVLKPLLDSLVQQHMLRNDLQIILADDCSIESYQDLVDEYKYKLNIKQTSTAYNCCPGNTRQAGVDKATGEWLVFADHDDSFFPNILPKIRKEIEENHCDTVVISKFVKTDKNRTVYKEMPTAGWTHGKFFNKDNFWDKYNFHYIKDLTSHEDISISSQMNCVFSREKNNHMKILQSNTVTYQWVERDESESNRAYYDEFGVQRPFLDIFYIDYLNSTAGVYYTKYQEGMVSKSFAEQQIKQVLLYAYFYAEGNYFVTESYLKKNYQEITKYINILKNDFGLTIEDIFNYYKKDNFEIYKEIFQTSLIATGVVIYNYTLKDWLYKMQKGDY